MCRSWKKKLTIQFKLEDTHALSVGQWFKNMSRCINNMCWKRMEWDKKCPQGFYLLSSSQEVTFRLFCDVEKIKLNFFVRFMNSFCVWWEFRLFKLKNIKTVKILKTQILNFILFFEFFKFVKKSVKFLKIHASFFLKNHWRHQIKSITLSSFTITQHCVSTTNTNHSSIWSIKI